MNSSEFEGLDKVLDNEAVVHFLFLAKRLLYRPQTPHSHDRIMGGRIDC